MKTNNTKWSKKLGLKIKKTILSSGYNSLRDFYNSGGSEFVSMPTLSRITNGTVEIRLCTLVDIAHFLELETEYFID